MKKIFFIIGFFWLQTSNAQDITITEVNVSSISTDEINVNLKVITNASEYISSSYSINGSEINLDVCYITYGIDVIANLENNIPITLPSVGDYNLHITIYQSFSNICDYNNIQDTATLSFTTPLNGTVTLGTADILNIQTNILYPNPTTGILKTDNFVINSYIVYDNLGRKIKQYNSLRNNTIDISEFDNGMYFIEAENLDKTIIKRIILKK